MGGGIRTVVAHRRVDESSDVRDVGSVRCFVFNIYRTDGGNKTTFRTHEKTEFDASITRIETVLTVALWGIFELQ
jgi:hypothetical protein